MRLCCLFRVAAMLESARRETVSVNMCGVQVSDHFLSSLTANQQSAPLWTAYAPYFATQMWCFLQSPYGTKFWQKIEGKNIFKCFAFSHILIKLLHSSPWNVKFLRGMQMFWGKKAKFIGGAFAREFKSIYSIQFKFICIALFMIQIVAKQLYRKC